jgi:membrane protein
MARNGIKHMLRMLRIVWTAARCLVDDEGLELSGYLAFMALLALFPFLIFLSSLASILGGVVTGERFVAFMLEFAPGSVSATLGPAIGQIFSSRQGGTLTFSALFMLWTASNGVEAMRAALNRAYRSSETRPLWYRRLQSVGFVALGSLAVILLSLAIVLGPLLWHIVTRFVKGSAPELILWQTARYAVAACATFLMLLVLHRWLPNTRRGIGDLIPGVIVTVTLLLGAASLFSLYLETVTSYNLIYGSLDSAVVTLVYLYANAVTFIFGAEFNAAIWRARSEMS